jgi:hypothetical protein
MDDERPHGYARYVLDSCRDAACVTAFGAYSEVLLERESAVLGSQFVPIEPVREHVRALLLSNLSMDEVAKLAWLTPEQIAGIEYSRWVKISAHVAMRVLSIPVQEQPTVSNARWDGAYVWAMIDGLVAAGWTKTQIAREVLGSEQLQLSRNSVRAGSARAIEAKYREVVGDPTPLRREKVE